MIVVDASVLSTALVDDGADGERARARLRDEELAAPSLIDLEVTSVWRGRVRGGQVNDHRAALALADLMALPMQRVPPLGLLARVWHLRDNLTVYDASYVALAEILNTVLVTADVRISKAPGIQCQIEILT
jgi:predicted nucleic acid-binding protein